MERGWHLNMSDVLISYLFGDDIHAARHLDSGIELMKYNRFVEAIVEFENTLKFDPKNKHARWNKAVSLLSIGDYVNGLRDHECAWEIYDWHALDQFAGNIHHILDLPIWHGERCRLLVYHEMGSGDAIMTLRFLSKLVSHCECVTLVVVPELVSLLQGYGATIIDYVPQISEFDARVSFFGSIAIMGYTLQTIPSEPYIKSDFKFNGCKKIGITWSGNSRKEFNVTSFLSHLDLQGFEVYALQKSEPIAGIIQLQAGNFKDTSELVKMLDCIVSVDTAAVHLAGAMGHPNTHLIVPYNRDWRWWHKDIWYPTINIYPQDDPDDWSMPFARLNAAIGEKIIWK